MMEWLAEDANRGELVLTAIAIGITICVIWFGRKKLSVSIPLAIVFLLLAAIAIPSFIPARTMAQRAACINNLKLIENAKGEWAKFFNKSPNDIPTLDDLCGTNHFLRVVPQCPKGGGYSIGPLNKTPTCSFGNKGHELK